MNSSAARRSFTFLSLFLIAAVCLLCYSNTFHVPFQFDDPYNLSEKAFVKDISAFFDSKRIETDYAFIMRPVGYFTFAVNYWLHGNEVVGYHVVNLAIHVINGFLVYFLVLLTFRTPYFATAEEVSFPQAKRVGNPSEKPSERLSTSHGRTSRSDKQGFSALFAALLFVSHPVQTQAVTYIVQRLASLAALFFLLSLVTYIKWRLIKQESEPVAYRETAIQEPGAGTKNTKSEILSSKSGWRSTVWYLSSLISAVLAMKTKEIAFTLPVLIALYEFLFFEGTLKKRVLYLLPLLLTMLIIPLSLMGMTRPAGEIIGDLSEATKVGSRLTRWEYLFTEFRVIVTYIRLLIFPVNQNLDYDYPVYHTFFDPNVILSFLFLSALFGIGVYLIYKSRIDSLGNHRGIAPTTHSSLLTPHLRFVSFGIFWLFITLSVESGIIPITDVVFEHRVYLPSVGFFIAVTASLFIVWERLKGKTEWAGKAAVGGFLAVIILLSVATYLRNNVWRSEVTLWQDVAVKSPVKARSYNGLGLAYQKEGRIDEALESFARAVSIDPSYAVAYNSLGTAYFRKNLFGRSVEEFSRAIALEPGNTIFRNNRGLAYAALGEMDGAIADYLQALALDSSYAEAYHNLGSAFHGKGLYERAVEEYTKAIKLEADNAIYYNNRGLSLSALREFERAIADYVKAIALKPDFAEAYVGKGVVNGGLGHFDAAVRDFTRAISLDPSKASSYVNRAVAYEQMQNIGMAMSDFQKACELGDDRGCGGVEYMRKKYQTGK